MFGDFGLALSLLQWKSSSNAELASSCEHASVCIASAGSHGNNFTILSPSCQDKGEWRAGGETKNILHLQKGNTPLPALPGKEGVATVGSLR